MRKCIEGSNAVAQVVRLCRPGVVCAYPITPQTHIVEDLSKFKSNGEADYEYIRADSEFAAASIVLGASATGVRAYTATCSQGLLLMTEVIFTIAGLRMPIVMTVANRAISAPINIWNDQQDSMTVRDSGWIMLYAEDNQEAVDMHMLAFKVAEQTRIPVMVNMDGFVLTHTYEQVDLPDQKQVDQYLPEYIAEPGQFLDTKNPKTLGAFATPEDYLEIREDLYKDLIVSKIILKKQFAEIKKMFGRGSADLVEYYGAPKAKIIFVAMGSVIGTIKNTVDELNAEGQKTAVVKVKSFRPFPTEEVQNKLALAQFVAVIDKSVSLGQEGILATEIKACLNGKVKVQSFVAGLGGRDITRQKLKKIYKDINKKQNKTVFVK